MRNVVRKGFTAELRKRNTTHDSINAKYHFCLSQLSQFAAITIATKYGIRERTRNSKIKK